MATQHRDPASRSWPSQEKARQEEEQEQEDFKRHGPEPPENDSGPSPSIEEMDRYSDFSIRNVDEDEQVD